jgi:hypothetical protein
MYREVTMTKGWEVRRRGSPPGPVTLDDESKGESLTRAQAEPAREICG